MSMHPIHLPLNRCTLKKLLSPKAQDPGRPPKPKKIMPEDLCYATVCKKREKGKVVQVVRKIVFRTMALLMNLLGFPQQVT
jgi:hypothetical protein